MGQPPHSDWWQVWSIMLSTHIAEKGIVGYRCRTDMDVRAAVAMGQERKVQCSLISYRIKFPLHRGNSLQNTHSVRRDGRLSGGSGR